ncbi:hypothetical protein QJS04_geneDACA009058 [Acorus gramineus]|uniref:DDT domain-containing protein n=1 Tax=Acorus gramineus TaxID=55184 RepID=A0AAV9AT00_ACOGR|nr:hypothetical protein QJS04_geneDACA009058 [Acorus gramineus]
MPLFKRKPFSLAVPPDDLDPNELVYQVRFTKEIFRDYREYLNRLNLYRQRSWTCKVTGKTNLTYEEALVSEQRAIEKVQEFPQKLMMPTLQMIQFSTLNLNDLVNAIAKKLQEHFLEGAELYGKKDESVCACKILKVLEKEGGNVEYKVGWFNTNKTITGTSILGADDLIRKKPPFTRSVIKSFIRESTLQSAPWVVHEKLARKHGISTEPCDEVKHKFIVLNGCVRPKKEKTYDIEMKTLDADEGKNRKKRQRVDTVNSEVLESLKKKAKEVEEKPKVELIKYPIDDFLVKPGKDDPVFTDRPSPSTDFRLPLECVGDLLMVWDFCSSFSRLLNLFPFSLENFEKAVCHKNSNLGLIVEVHSAILSLLIKDEGDYFEIIKKKNRKSKITLMKWTEYVCDFLEMEGMTDLSRHSPTTKRGHYGYLDIQAKLSIFCVLVEEAINTNAIRQQLDEYVEQQQALAAMKRGESRKKKEQKNLKGEDDKEVMGHDLDNEAAKLQDAENQVNEIINSSKRNHISKNRKHAVMTSKLEKNPKMDAKPSAENASKSNGIAERQRGGWRRKGRVAEIQEKKDEKQEEHFEREIEKRFVRTSPLGKDKFHNRYWFFRRDGRIFVESSDSKQWGYYSSKEELNSLMGSLNPKGVRERNLKKQLEKHYQRISLALQKRSKDMAQRVMLESAVLRRSTRVRAPPKENPAMAFLNYINKWKEN